MTHKPDTKRRGTHKRPGRLAKSQRKQRLADRLKRKAKSNEDHHGN